MERTSQKTVCSCKNIFTHKKQIWHDNGSSNIQLYMKLMMKIFFIVTIFLLLSKSDHWAKCLDRHQRTSQGKLFEQNSGSL